MVKIGQKVLLKGEINTAQGVREYTVVDILQRNEVVLKRDDGTLFWISESEIKDAV